MTATPTLPAPTLEPTPAPAKPPQAVLGEMINGYWVSLSVHAAAALGIADRLRDGPRSVGELASETHTDPDALFRLLRALASLGVFAQTDAPAGRDAASRRFAQTPLSEALRSDVPASMHGLALLTGRLHLRAWPEILHSVRTGRPATELVFGGGLFEHLERDPETAAAFDAAMAGYTGVVARAVLGAYDFSRFRTIVDVGGGAGALLAAVLAATPGARGVNFDLPHVADRARALLAERGVAERCDVESGDFFARVPDGGDAYLLKMILHDWDDDHSITILRRVREAIARDGRVLVLEAVIPDGNAPSPGKLLDVNMLVMTGGRERTRDEFASLYAAAGFVLEDVVPAHPTTSIVVGRPV